MSNTDVLTDEAIAAVASPKDINLPPLGMHQDIDLPAPVPPVPVAQPPHVEKQVHEEYFGKQPLPFPKEVVEGLLKDVAATGSEGIVVGDPKQGHSFELKFRENSDERIAFAMQKLEKTHQME